MPPGYRRGSRYSLGVDTTELTQQFALDPQQFFGIPLALIGAVFLSLGAQFQHRGVGKVEAKTDSSVGKGLSIKQLTLLLARPSWVLGTTMLGLAVLFQLASLYFSPLIVVQPLGAIALVMTAVLNSRVARVRLNPQTVAAITMCVGGVFVFVGVAAFTATDRVVTERDLVIILSTLLVVLLALGISFLVLRHRMTALYYVLGAGVLYGFVATLAKVVLGRLQQGEFEWLTWTCVVALLSATALGAYFVQNAYASGPPDLVIAGLTVVDPLVAVLIGVVVLGEAAQAPLWADIVFVVTGAIAVTGVFRLARHHPQTQVVGSSE